MPQLFSNNATTTLAALLSDSATSMSVTAATGFAAVTSPDYELVTLTAAGVVEIVKVTAQAGATWTIARGQEGTTAREWAAGTTVEARVTAGTLDGMMQAEAHPDVSGLDHGGNARGSDALNLQPSRSVADKVASGTASTAVGASSKASGSYSSALGAYSTAAGLYGVALGNGAATGPYAIAAGYGAMASATQTVAIGAGTDATQNNSVAIGGGAQATGIDSVAVGGAAQSQGNSGTAIGGASAAHGSNSAAIGYRATAFGTQSANLNGGSPVFSSQSLTARGYWCVSDDDWNDLFENWAASTQSVFATPYVDLGVPPDWAASTAYSHGQIVKPTAGGTVQYRAWCSYADDTLLHLTPTSDAAEPTWPSAGDNVSINATDNAEWIGIDLDAGYETETFPDWLEFWPSEIAFICQDYTATTGTPTVSIGTPTSPTLILSAASVGITAAGQVFRFTLPNPCPRIPEGESILVTLDSAASAGQMAGRFVFTGAFVATRSRT